LGHGREQSNAASYAGACEPNAEPMYEAPRAASSPADGRDVGGRIEILERLEALHQGSCLGYLGATVSLPPHTTRHPPELPTSTTVNICYSNWHARSLEILSVHSPGSWGLLRTLSANRRASRPEGRSDIHAETRTTRNPNGDGAAPADGG